MVFHQSLHQQSSIQPQFSILAAARKVLFVPVRPLTGRERSLDTRGEFSTLPHHHRAYTRYHL